MLKKIGLFFISTLFLSQISYAETKNEEIYNTLIEPLKTYQNLSSSPIEELRNVFLRKYSIDPKDPNSTTNLIKLFNSSSVFENINFYTYPAKGTDNKEAFLYMIKLEVKPEWMRTELGFTEENNASQSLVCQKQLNLVSDVMEEKYKTKFKHLYISKGSQLKAKIDPDVSISLYCSSEQVVISIVNTDIVQKKFEENSLVRKELINKNIKHF